MIKGRRGRPDLRGMCHQKWLKTESTKQTDRRFRMVYGEKGDRIVSSLLNTVTWSHSVNSEDFLIAEANHVQIQHAFNLASISSANLGRSRM